MCCTNTRLLGLCLLSVPDKKGNALGRSQKTERPWTLMCHQHQRATWSTCVVCSTHVDHVYLFTRTCRNYILFLQTGVLTPSHRRQTEIASASLEPRGGFGSRISKIKAPEQKKKQPQTSLYHISMIRSHSISVFPHTDWMGCQSCAVPFLSGKMISAGMGETAW